MQIKLENNVLKTKINEARTCVSQSRKSVSLSGMEPKRTITESTRPVVKSHTFNGQLLHLEPSLDMYMSNNYF